MMEDPTYAVEETSIVQHLIWLILHIKINTASTDKQNNIYKTQIQLICNRRMNSNTEIFRIKMVAVCSQICSNFVNL